MTKQSLDAVRRVFIVQQPKDIERDGRALLVRTARAGIAQITQEQTNRAGIAPGVAVYANRPGNAALETVRLPGPIVARWDYRREIALATLAALRRASPVQSGAYRDAHELQLNGVAVETLPANLAPGDEIRIVNAVPYARRLEIGKTKSGRDFVLKVEPRIYERVAKGQIAPRYRNVAKITFTYVLLPQSHVIKGGLASHYTVGTFGPGGTHGKRRRRQEIGGKVKAPCIMIGGLL
mgnify:CR=1 FL=1